MAWYNSSWGKRKAITLTGGASGAQTDYQVKLTVIYDSDMQADFDDLRFTKSDGTTLLDAWMETYTASTSATIWVETDTPDNTVEADIYMYYGNLGAVSSWSGDNTFEFFDNFEIGTCSGAAPDWTNESGASFTKVSTPVQNGSCAADHSTSTTYAESYQSVGTNLSDRVFEFYARVPQSDVSEYMMIEKTAGSYSNAVYLYFGSGPKIYYYDGTTHEIQTYGINQWYRFEITTHPTADTFDLKIDGVSKGTGLGTRGSIVGGINAISFMSSSTSKHLYIDMIFMRKYAANPATYGFGSEEDVPSTGSRCRVLFGPFMGPLGGPIG